MPLRLANVANLKGNWGDETLAHNETDVNHGMITDEKIYVSDNL